MREIQTIHTCQCSGATGERSYFGAALCPGVTGETILEVFSSSFWANLKFVFQYWDIYSFYQNFCHFFPIAFFKVPSDAQKTR